MAAPRKFDYDEARRLRTAGLSYATIADRLGVSSRAVFFAVNPEACARDRALGATWQRAGVCPDCGGQATRVGGVQHRCRPCASKRATTSVRPDTLLCFGCREWKPDDAFPFERTQRGKRRRERHGLCRHCQTKAKRAWRRKHPTYERDYYRQKRAAA